MKFFDRQIVITFFSSCIFLFLFPGLFSCYFIFYSNYFDQTTYEWYAFYDGGHMPSKLEMLMSGFKNLEYAATSISISVLFILLYHLIARKVSFGNRFLSFLIHTAGYIIILSGLYSAYLILFHKPLNPNQMEYMKMELILFLSLSVIPGVINTLICNRFRK